ncbi:HotDog domain-containing protein, partial [Tuber brumale]
GRCAKIIARSQLKLINVEPGKVDFELLIEKMHTNRLGTLHGGTIASMVDLGGSLAVASKGLFSTGVSTDLNVTYLSSGGKVGHVIRGEATCDKFGKTLAYTTVLFRNKDDQLVARGSHTKFVYSVSLLSLFADCGSAQICKNCTH